MSSWTELFERLKLRATAWSRERPNSPAAAIDLWADDSEESRLEAHSVVRAALSDGTRPARLGVAFVAVIADLAYDIDWGDQFSFWPLLNRRLDAHGFDLRESTRRDECAHAFRSVARDCGLLTPRGQFAESFPLMSLPLFHAVLPRCAHRRVAELLADATPTDDLAALARARGAPHYLVGLLEHDDLRERLARLSLDDETADAGVLPRLRKDIDNDLIAREMLRRARSSSGGDFDRGRVPMRLALHLGPPATLSVEFGPVDSVERMSEPFARAVSEFMSITFVVSTPGAPSRVVEGGYLLNARGRAQTVSIAVDPGQVEFEVNAVTSSMASPNSLAACIPRPLKVGGPVVFRKGPSCFYFPHRDTRVHRDEVVAVLGSTAASVTLPGFGAATPVANSSWWVGYGELDPVAAASLGLTVADYTQIHPAFNPPLSATALSCDYDRRDVACFWVRGLAASNRVVLACGDDVRDVSSSAIGAFNLLRVSLHEMREGARLLVLDNAGLEVSTLAVSQRSRRASNVETLVAALQPPGVTIDQLTEGVCWVEAWTPDDCEVVLRVEGALGAAVEAKLSAPEYSLRDAAADAFFTLIKRLSADCGGDLSQQAPLRLTVRRVDTQDRSHVIAELRSTSSSRLARMTGDEAIVASLAATPVRVWFTAIGQGRVELPGTDKLTLASEEGLYVLKCAEATSSVVWASGHVPLSTTEWPLEADRSLEDALATVHAMRELDHCFLGPERSLARAEELRRSLIVEQERILSRVLCGRTWLIEEAATAELSCRQTVERLAPLAGFNLEAMNELVSNVEMFRPTMLPTTEGARSSARSRAGARNLLQEFIGEACDEEAQISELATHLLLLFRRRAAAPRSRDRDALTWAYANPRAARFVRLIDVITKRAAAEKLS
jgi:hypothetical protein